MIALIKYDNALFLSIYQSIRAPWALVTTARERLHLEKVYIAPASDAPTLQAKREEAWGKPRLAPKAAVAPQDAFYSLHATKEEMVPYILPEKRAVLDPFLEQLAVEVETQGELNYCIYKLSTLLINRLGESYDTLSLCSSAMEHAKLEWYRRRLVPYEEHKIVQNGDI